MRQSRGIHFEPGTHAIVAKSDERASLSRKLRQVVVIFAESCTRGGSTTYIMVNIYT